MFTTELFPLFLFLAHALKAFEKWMVVRTTVQV
jgi:hypothetical protein